MKFKNLSTRTTNCAKKFSTTQYNVYDLSIKVVDCEKSRKNLSTILCFGGFILKKVNNVLFCRRDAWWKKGKKNL
jgi:hypothetical protein